MSDTKMTIGKKLAKARKLIAVSKSGYNSFGKYNYYKIDDIYSGSKAILEELGIASSVETDVVCQNDTVFYKFTLKLYDVDDMDKFIPFSAITEPNELKAAQQSQEAGATITYMTKYLYGMALFLDDGEHDPDIDYDPKAKTPPSKGGRKLSRDEIIDAIKAKGAPFVSDVLEKYSATEGKKVTDLKYVKQAFLNSVDI